MTTAEANRVHRELHDDRTAGVWRSVDVPETALEVCVDLGRRYGLKPGVQTLDSLHVAVPAVEVQVAVGGLDIGQYSHLLCLALAQDRTGMGGSRLAADLWRSLLQLSRFIGSIDRAQHNAPLTR
jgi:hypothetical protein